MKQRALGATGLSVSELALGAGPLGSDAMEDAAAVGLVLTAFDLGVTLVDTAPSYGRSELRIGIALHELRGRRDHLVISTKLGYGVPGVADWTGPCIAQGIDLALARLGTDRIDIAHLHSCPADVLERDDIRVALDAGVRAGKVRVVAYSGDGAPLEQAIASGRFGVVQCSVSIADQRALDGAVARAAAAGIGVLAKRPLANAVWGEAMRPGAPDRAAYWDRLRAMGWPLAEVEADQMASYALRFVLAQPGVAAALVGTTSVTSLRAAVAAAARGPLDALAVADARARFARCDVGWDGIV